MCICFKFIRLLEFTTLPPLYRLLLWTWFFSVCDAYVCTNYQITSYLNFIEEETVAQRKLNDWPGSPSLVTEQDVKASVLCTILALLKLFRWVLLLREKSLSSLRVKKGTDPRLLPAWSIMLYLQINHCQKLVTNWGREPLKKRVPCTLNHNYKSKCVL